MTALLFEAGGNIREAAQFEDAETATFFMRLVAPLGEAGLVSLNARLAALGADQGMTWAIRSADQARKALLRVSKSDHCLADLLYRRRIGEIPMDVVGIVSNHLRSTFDGLELGHAPFHHFPVTRDTKSAQEARIKALVYETGEEPIVLARYMQILSDDMSAFLSGRCINIHHSFLPGFKGAKP